MLHCKNGVLQNILLLFGPRYSLLCSQVCHWILSWIGQGSHPCKFMINLYSILPSLIADEVFQWCRPSCFTAFCAFYDLATSSPFVWSESRSVRRVHEVIWSFKCNSDRWPVCKNPPTTQKSRHLWFRLKIILSHKIVNYALLCPTNPFKILCTSLQTLIQHPVLLWSCSPGITLPVLETLVK